MRDIFGGQEDETKPPPCEHLHTEASVCASGPHYAKLTCKSCNKFVKWVKAPKNSAQAEINMKKALDLWNEPKLTPWERQFVVSIGDGTGKISPKQQATLNGLWVRFTVNKEIGHAP